MTLDRTPAIGDTPSCVRAERVALAVGVLALLAAVGLGWRDKALFAERYLVVFFFFLSASLGALFFVLVHHVTRAGWSVVVRRLAENVAGVLPLFVLLYLPIALLAGDLYPWAGHAFAEHNPELAAHKASYLNLPFFLTRAFVFLLIWAALGTFFRRLSVRADTGDGSAMAARLRAASPIGLILFGLSITYASFDWLMSLEPAWYSTIFGVTTFAGAVIAGLAVVILLTLRLRSTGALEGVVTAEHDQDLGKLLFGFVVFWTYVAFSEFMLQWYANMPEETVYYQSRMGAAWQSWSVALALGHFVIPFFFLLSRHIKRRPVLLGIGAVWILAAHLLHLYWIVLPALHPEGASLGVLDLLCLLGVGGLFGATVIRLSRGASLVPVRDPFLSESLAFENQ
ncbi:MAG: hypothetical protein D6729_01620 [Deltaproteobacteria bacterium]|nr:MAG: hypothetical protein D6729_01620 [Deltaproteobacteria bacterium]